MHDPISLISILNPIRTLIILTTAGFSTPHVVYWAFFLWLAFYLIVECDFEVARFVGNDHSAHVYVPGSGLEEALEGCGGDSPLWCDILLHDAGYRF